jgi:hypothetical protein
VVVGTFCGVYLATDYAGEWRITERISETSRNEHRRAPKIGGRRASDPSTGREGPLQDRLSTRDQ